MIVLPVGVPAPPPLVREVTPESLEALGGHGFHPYRHLYRHRFGHPRPTGYLTNAPLPTLARPHRGRFELLAPAGLPAGELDHAGFLRRDRWALLGGHGRLGAG